MFCKHEWKVLSETTTKSQFEVAMEASNCGEAKPTSLPWQLCNADRKFIQVVACDKCGKLKRFVEII